VSSEPTTSNFIYNIIDEDIKNNVYENNMIQTRFPPEPNGYLHIGHAKSILLNYNTSQKYHGKFHLRFDDTNPVKEDIEYVESIKEDIKWLGVNWEDNIFFASNYFEKMYNYAIELIQKGLAYVDDLTAEEIKNYRGTLTSPGKESPYRNRSIQDNLALFTSMKAGEFSDGSKVLRAIIDMSSPNINLRDPIIYRILHAHHHNTSDAWCIYPMYDYAHPIEDAIEGITHSICTLEFEDHRPFYNWLLENLDDYKIKRPKQIEFAKLQLSRAIIGKRFIRELVDTGVVDGWDDPRLMTISGMRRRGITSEAIQKFCDEIGVAKSNSLVDIAMFEHFIRDDLKTKTIRVMAVLDPIKVIITNYPEGEIEWLDMLNNQDNESLGNRKIPFGREIYIEKDDFMEEPPKKYFRLFPGNEVRLMGAYFIKCNEVIKDNNGNITQLHCTYDPETKSGSGFTGRKVKGTLHWVCATDCVESEIRLYDYLLKAEDEVIEDGEDHSTKINPNSLRVITGYLEPELAKAKSGDKFQFVRNGYFVLDSKDSTDDKLVFNLTVNLKSSWKPNK